MSLTTAEQSLQQRIQHARQNKTPIGGRDDNRGVDLPGAYRIQAASGAGRALKGYKLGLISPAKQRQMGLETPIYGRIYADMLHQGAVDVSRFVQPRMEPEVALVLRDDVPPDTTLEQSRDAIGGAFLGVDILDSVWADYKFTAVEVVADNTSGGGFLLSERLRTQLPSGSLRLYLNGQLRTEGAIETLGDPLNNILWLANTVGGLRAGQIIFLGSPAAAVPARPGTLELIDSTGDRLIAQLR